MHKKTLLATLVFGLLAGQAVAAHVLALHRQAPAYRAQQAEADVKQAGEKVKDAFKN